MFFSSLKKIIYCSNIIFLSSTHCISSNLAPKITKFTWLQHHTDKAVAATSTDLAIKKMTSDAYHQ